MTHPFPKQSSVIEGSRGKNPAELENKIIVLLADYACPGQPPTYTDEQIIKILEIACHTPKEYGYKTSHWSLNQLANKLFMLWQPACIEFEYIRHNTTSLIRFFDVATGRMEQPYLNFTRTEEDFVKAVRALVETDSGAS